MPVLQPRDVNRQSGTDASLKRKNSTASATSSTPSSTTHSRATSATNKENRFGYKGPVVDVKPSLMTVPQPEPTPSKRRRTRGSLHGHDEVSSSSSTTRTGTNTTHSAVFRIPDPIVQSMVNELFTEEFNDEVGRAQKLKITAAKFAYKELTAQQSSHITTLKTTMKQLQNKYTLLIDGALTIERNLISEMQANISKAQSTADQVSGLVEQINTAQKTIHQLKSDKRDIETQLRQLTEQHSSAAATIAGKQSEVTMMEQQMAVMKADSELLISKLDEKESECELHKTNVAALEADLAASVAQLTDAGASQSDTAKRLDATQQQLEQTQRQLQQAGEQHTELTQQYQTLTNDMTALQQQKQSAEKQISDLQIQLSQMTDKHNESAASVKALQLELKELNKSMEHLRTVHAAEVERYSEKLESSRQTSAMKIEYELQSKVDQIDSLQRERDLVKHGLEELKAKMDSIKEENTSLHKEVSRAEQRVVSLDGEKTSLARQLALMEVTLESKNNELKQALSTFDRSQNILESSAVAVRNEKVALESKYENVTREKYEADKLLRDMTDVCNGVKQELKQAHEQIEKLKVSEQSLTQLLDEQKSKFMIQEQLVKDQLAALQAETTTTIDALKADVAKLQSRGDAAAERADTLAAELANFKKHCNVSNEKQLEEMVRVSVEAEKLKAQLGDKANLADKLNDAEAQLQAMKIKLAVVERDRRALHNQVQELRGNVRVMVRIRPLGSNDSDGVGGNTSAIDTLSDGKRLKISTEKAEVKTFGFDNVFGQASKQAEVFDEVSQLIQSALDGYNVCLFSYGQTGSGKTWTMQGAAHGDNRGIIPRAVELIIQRVSELRSEGWVYAIEASMLEIYNENVRDLLGKHSLASDDGHDNLDIKRDPVTNASRVEHLTKIAISSEQDVATLISMANKQRATAKTDMNERSSRSHSVFTLYLTGENGQLNLKLASTLNLVDLAGSERLSRTGTQGDATRLKETQSINKSLSSLADVFSAIGQHAKHIPFRNSKLTYLLEPCFSGDGKTLMIVNLSPTVASSGESVCSLRFASQVNQCELGKPTKNKKTLTAQPSHTATDDDSEMETDPPVLSRPTSSTAPSSAKKLTSKPSSAASTSRLAQLNGKR